MPVYPGQAAGTVATGSYTGNGGAARAIPHGLTGTPSLVLIMEYSNASCYFHWIHNTFMGGTAGGSVQSGTVTAIDSTNFYVGDGVDAVKTANGNGMSYRWVAFI